MNITVIGAGNMGGALIHGWAKSGKLSSITISDKNEALLASFKEKYPSINITTDNVAAVKGADIVVVVVKPWLMPVVLGEIKPALDLEKQIIVSDAANFTTSMLTYSFYCLVNRHGINMIRPALCAKVNNTNLIVSKSRLLYMRNFKSA